MTETTATRIAADPGYLRIATEEAFATADMLERYRALVAGGKFDDPGFHSLWGFYLSSPSERARLIIDRLQNLGEVRL